MLPWADDSRLLPLDDDASTCALACYSAKLDIDTLVEAAENPLGAGPLPSAGSDACKRLPEALTGL